MPEYIRLALIQGVISMLLTMGIFFYNLTNEGLANAALAIQGLIHEANPMRDRDFYLDDVTMYKLRTGIGRQIAALPNTELDVEKTSGFVGTAVAYLRVTVRQGENNHYLIRCKLKKYEKLIDHVLTGTWSLVRMEIRRI